MDTQQTSSRKKKQFSLKATTLDKRGRIIAVGFNDYAQTHPVQASLAKQAGCPEKLYLHAEVAAIIKSRKKRIDSIVIERYDSEGRPKLAKPCPVCEIAIKQAGIRWVRYTVG
jgi:deoxycytidylate deaminase